jgi:hypothetical protein
LRKKWLIDLHFFCLLDTDQGYVGLDQTILMLTLAVFIMSCPPDVTNVANIREPCIQLFTNAWSSAGTQVRFGLMATSVTEISPKNVRLSKPTDITLHWDALEEHFLMALLVF